MKNVTQIISSIQNQPQFSKLYQCVCINKIKSVFTPLLQKMIKFGYIKGDTLFFVLNHPAGKQEFDNSIDNIKSALKFYKPAECDGIEFCNIKAFVTHTPSRNNTMKIVKQFYKERSKGEFETDIKDKNLKQIAVDIKNIIKQNNEH